MTLADKLHTALPVGAVVFSSAAFTGALQSLAYVVTITYTLFKLISDYKASKRKKDV